MPRPATSSRPAACSSRSTSARRATASSQTEAALAAAQARRTDRADADGARRIAVQVADADAGRLRADAARVRECRVAGREHERRRRERAHHARGHGRARADHGHDHREDGRARHRDRVADARRERRHDADEDGGPHAPCRCARASTRPTSARSSPACVTRVTVAAYPNQPFDGEVLEDRAAGDRRAERHACSRCSSRSRIAAGC